MAYLFILIGAVLRVLPHAANFAPIGAISLFGGTYLNKKLAVVVPVAAMIVSDFFIGFDSLESRLSVYGCFALIALIGMAVRKRKNVVTILGGSVAGSILFFLITNFVWFHSTGMYEQTFQGLMAAYTNALPFFRNTLFSDLIYTSAFFGSFELVQAVAKRRLHATNYQSSR
jgi:hypothetical protein